MNIFISWSGKKGRRVAVALRAFLQDVNQRIIPWFSDSDIEPGARWGLKLADQLDSTSYGIVCVTQEALQSPWVLFEAGALSKSVSGARVCPYLIDARREELPAPLSQFQARDATQSDTWDMLQSINRSMGDDALGESRLQRYFDTFWPPLDTELQLVNSELRSLPAHLLVKMLEVIPVMLYRVTDAEMIGFYRVCRFGWLI